MKCFKTNCDFQCFQYKDLYINCAYKEWYLFNNYYKHKSLVSIKLHLVSIKLQIEMDFK